MIGPKGDEDMLRVLLRSSVCSLGSFTLDSLESPHVIVCVCVCALYCLQDAGAIIGKSGSNVRELRTKVKALHTAECMLETKGVLCICGIN